MARKTNSKVRQTSTRSWIAVAGTPCLYKRTGARVTGFLYRYPDGHVETLARAPTGNRAEVAAAELTAKRLALDIVQGRVVVGSVGELIDRFLKERAPLIYADQSKNGIKERQYKAANLKEFFGLMNPRTLKALHGYQYLEARAVSGAPEAANKEMNLFKTICNQAVKWGLIDTNPFVDLEMNVTDRKVRIIGRHQVVRFYLWCVKQGDQQARTMGAAAMFSYLTGYRATEVRPFLKEGITERGVTLLNAKRQLGGTQVVKLREWSKKLRVVVARALERQDKRPSKYLFATVRRSQAYTRHGWGSVWRSVWARYLNVKEKEVTTHPDYFALQDIRPMAITVKLEKRSVDAYDFAAHASPTTTNRHYDRRKINVAKATE